MASAIDVNAMHGLLIGFYPDVFHQGLIGLGLNLSFGLGLGTGVDFGFKPGNRPDFRLFKLIGGSKPCSINNLIVSRKSARICEMVTKDR
jgi:hypothetical protein